MTKAALEAIVNALLAPAQPITANGKHKPSMQAVIDEMYDGQSRGDVLSTVASVVSLAGGDVVLIIRGGVAKLIPVTVFGVEHYRGDFDPTGDVLPTTGGNYTGGAAARGDKWRLTADYKGFEGIIEAAVDDPQDDGDWNFYPVTSI